MAKYINADMLEKDGWNMQRIRQVSSTKMVYETKKPTDFPAADGADDSQLPINENRSLCKLRHRNGNCLCVGGFCTAVNDEICKSIRMAYEKGYVDGKTDEVRHGRWIKKYRGNYLCSVCGAWYRTTDDYGNIIDGEMRAKYCEVCGAKMENAAEPVRGEIGTFYIAQCKGGEEE